MRILLNVLWFDSNGLWKNFNYLALKKVDLLNKYSYWKKGIIYVFKFFIFLIKHDYFIYKRNAIYSRSNRLNHIKQINTIKGLNLWCLRIWKIWVIYFIKMWNTWWDQVYKCLSNIKWMFKLIRSLRLKALYINWRL